jgi:hypothetical protein
MIEGIAGGSPIITHPETVQKNTQTLTTSNTSNSPSSFVEAGNTLPLIKPPLSESEQKLISHHQNIDLDYTFDFAGLESNTINLPVSALRTAYSKIILDNYLKDSSTIISDDISKNWSDKGLCQQDISPDALKSLLIETIRKSEYENVGGQTLLVVYENSEPAVKSQLDKLAKNMQSKGLYLIEDQGLQNENVENSLDTFNALLNSAQIKTAKDRPIQEILAQRSLRLTTEEQDESKVQEHLKILCLEQAPDLHVKEALAKINGNIIPLKKLSEIQSNVRKTVAGVDQNLAEMINIGDISKFPALFDINVYNRKWLTSFPHQEIKPNEFTLNNGDVIKPDFIFDTRTVKYYSTEMQDNTQNVEAFELAIKGGTRGIFIGPLTKELSTDDRGKIKQLIHNIITGQLEPTEIECRVGLPKTNIVVENKNLRHWEKEHGLGGSLLDTEVFKSITSLNIDEEGSKAINVFSRYASLCSRPKPKQLVMDKPFMAVYANKDNVELVYMVNNPQI